MQLFHNSASPPVTVTPTVHGACGWQGRSWFAHAVHLGLGVASAAGCALLYERHAAQLPFLPWTVAATAGVAMPQDGRRLAHPVEEKPCVDQPILQLLGPDQGHGEGLVWRVRGEHRGRAQQEHGNEVLLHANIGNGDNNLVPTHEFGMDGAYGSISLQSGSNAHLTITSQDAKTNMPRMLSTLSLTFFDLNAGNGMQGDSITASKFTDYSLAEETSIKVEKHADGSATFRGVAHGTGDDNPFDPMYTGPQQRKRAVSLTYRNTSNIGCMLTAGVGKASSRFLFVPLRSLDCTLQPRGDFRGHLHDLDWRPLLEVPVVAGRQEQFLRWMVQQGDNVSAGDDLCVVRLRNGTTCLHKTSVDGTVRLLQSELEANDEIDLRLSERTLAVISRTKLSPLKASGNDSTIVVIRQPGQVFLRWRSELNSYMRPGSVVADVRDVKGEHGEVHSNSSGILLARQDKLREGDPMDLITDGCVAVIGKLPPLGVEHGEAPTLAHSGLTFVAWTHIVNGFVEQGAEIAILKKPGGGLVRLLAPKAGLVRRKQDVLASGMDLDIVLTDTNLATIGQAPPLEIKFGEAAVRVPVGNNCLFEAWQVTVGSSVKHGDVVAFVRFLNGTRKALLAPKTGSVKAIQEHLRDGYVISDVVPNHDIAVIGKFNELVPSRGQLAVLAPPNAIFKRWLVASGDLVDKLECVAEVELLSEGNSSHRSDGGRRLVTPTHGEIFAAPHTGILSPHIGTMARLQPLVAGKKIEDQQTGLTIAIVALPVQGGSLNWQLLSGLAVGLCILAAIIFLVLRKRWPMQHRSSERTARLSRPDGPALLSSEQPTVRLFDEEGEDVELFQQEMKADLHPAAGIRLDFEDDGRVVTVYAEHYPLGIKQDDNDAAVVSGFFANSYARANLGVQIGWRLVRIENAVLSGGLKSQALVELLDMHMRELPTWPLWITFRHSTRGSVKADKACVFTEKPLGIELANGAPATVRKVQVDSPAQAAGVCGGWLIVGIGPDLVQPDTVFKETLGKLQQATSALPWSGKDFASGRSSCGPCGGGSSQALCM